MNKYLLITLSIILIFVLSCDEAQPAEGVEVLDCNAFSEKFKSSGFAYIVDVRTPDEFNQGTLLNAVNIDFYEDNFKANIDKLDKDKAIYVFCAKGGRSAKAASIAKELGFKEVYDLKGGYSECSSKIN